MTRGRALEHWGWATHACGWPPAVSLTTTTHDNGDNNCVTHTHSQGHWVFLSAVPSQAWDVAECKNSCGDNVLQSVQWSVQAAPDIVVCFSRLSVVKQLKQVKSAFDWKSPTFVFFMQIFLTNFVVCFSRLSVAKQLKQVKSAFNHVALSRDPSTRHLDG